MGNFFVLRLDPDFSVDDVQDDVGFANGQFRLIAHTGEDVVIGINEFNAPRIDHGKFPTEPFGIKINSVARNAGNIFNDGNSFLDNRVKQRRFADIRPTDDGD